MGAKGNDFKVTDFVSHDDADDALGDEDDLGSEVVAKEEVEEDPAPAKKSAAKKAPAKKSVAKEEEEDPEEEEEEDPEEEEEEDPEEEEEEDPKKPTQSEEEKRLGRKLSRTSRAREALEKQVQQLRSELEQQQQTRTDASRAKMDKLVEELDNLYEKVEEFRAEGKASDAAKAQKRIDEIRDGMTRSQAALMATRDAVQLAETRAYNTMVSELEVLDARFDPDSDDFDQELLDSVGELTEGYEAKGLPLTDALRKACKLLLREDVFAKGRSLKREKPKEKLPPRKTDVDKNLKAAKKQPPDNPGTRKERADAEIDMATISEKDYDALPESVRRRHEGYDG
jgi:hypothetical protein